MHFTKTQLTLCLLLAASGAPLFAEPRPAMPPAPESHLLLLRFDTVAELTATNKAPLALEGVTSSESFSGYSLHVGGEKPARITYPEINASGKANISFHRGAVRFWFKPDWSGENAGGKGPGTDARLLSLTGGETKAGVNERALLFDPTGSALYFSDVNRATLLQTKISWPAGQWHQVVLNYSADGTVLYLDGELAAKGDGVSAWPALKEPRAFTLGSDLNGKNLAQGDFEEFTTFAKNLTAEEIAWNYRMFSATAALGAITPEEVAAKKQMAKTGGQSSQQRMSLAPAGGGTNNFGGGNNFTYTNAQTGLRLVNPAWQSNQFTAEIAGGEAGGRYDLFHTTNLTAWDFVLRTAPGQTNLLVKLFADPPGFFLLGTMQDADGDTLTDAFESLVSKTSPLMLDTADEAGLDPTTAALLVDEPFAIYISHKEAVEHVRFHCATSLTVPLIDSDSILNWARGWGGFLSVTSLPNCFNPGAPSTYNNTRWDANDAASYKQGYVGYAPYASGTSNITPPKNFPAEYASFTVSNSLLSNRSRTASTDIELFTGGPKFSLQTNLFLVTVTATEMQADQVTPKSTNIPPGDISIMGLTLDTNGQVLLAAADRSKILLNPVLAPNITNAVVNQSVDQKLKLIIKNNNIAITNQQVMWAGQQVSLTCVMEPALGRLTNFNWIIPTNITAADHYVSPDTYTTNGWLLPVTNLTSASNIFYWTDEATFAVVKCTADVIAKNQTNTFIAIAFFEIRKPTADWLGTITGVIAVDANYGSSTQPLLHFGTRRDPNPGITFNFTNVNLKGYSNNYVFSCAQFGQSFWRRSFNGIAWIVADSIGAGLDTQFPAKVWPTNQPYGSFSDSPATAFVSNDTQTWRGNNLSMQLLFRPTGPSIPIALKRIDWDWLGHAVYTNAWELEISPTNAAHITATNAPVASTPAWTNNILIHRTDYNTNSLPPFK